MGRIRVRDDTRAGSIQVVARLSAESHIKQGEEAEIWLNATKLHFFEPDSGKALTST